jgi:hypothetical protein
MIVLIYIFMLGSVFYVEYSVVKTTDLEGMPEFSSTYASLLTYCGVCMLYNIDFIMTQYLMTIILVIISAISNHYIYGFGSTNSIRNLIFTICMVSMFSIGNYNLNKSIIL